MTHRKTMFVVMGLVLALPACGIHHCLTSHYRPVSYDRIIRTYFPADLGHMSDRSEIDIWNLWRDLGINHRVLRERRFYGWQGLWWALRRDPKSLITPAPNIFHAEPNRIAGFIDCDFASTGGTKVIAMAREHGCTQVLVFHRTGGEGDFRFAYQFVDDIHGMSDWPRVKLVQPEPGLMLLTLGYRNRHGTGMMGSGYSLYRLDARSARRLLKTDSYGYCMDCLGSGGYGYRCDSSDVSETWPRLDLEFYVEYVPDDRLADDPNSDDLLDAYELNAAVRLVWDTGGRTFRPDKGNVLSSRQIRALVRDSAGFLERRTHDAGLRSCPEGVITKVRRRESECLLDWGK